MTTKELRFKGTDIIFPRWLRDWGFTDREKREQGAATACRLLPNNNVLIMIAYPMIVSERPGRQRQRFQLELLDGDGNRIYIGAAGMPHILGNWIASAIKQNAIARRPFRKDSRVYNDAHGAGTITQLLDGEGGRRFCRVRWDLTGRSTVVSEGSCDLEQTNQSEATV